MKRRGRECVSEGVDRTGWRNMVIIEGRGAEGERHGDLAVVSFSCILPCP